MSAGPSRDDPRSFLDGHARAIVLLSGGLDSAVALYLSRAPTRRILALSFDYPARPPREAPAVAALARAAGVAHETVALPFLVAREDMTLDEGHPLSGFGSEIPGAYVPGRNLAFYAAAAARAEAIGASALVGGHLRGDSEGFPDASPAFFQRLERLIAMGSWAGAVRPVRIFTPLVGREKRDVVRLAIDLGVPLELTWSCYEDRAGPCGACVSCEERREAFREAGVPDPALSLA